MRIEIYVVETLNPSELMLQKLKAAIINLFGGLTEINFNGYWKDESGTIWHDTGKIWLIYAASDCKASTSDLIPILTKIKVVTQQQSQAYAINNEMRFL